MQSIVLQSLGFHFQGQIHAQLFSFFSATVTIPLGDIISVRLKDEKAVIVDGFGSSTVLSPAGSCYQVHPSAPQSPFIVSPTAATAAADDDPLWNDDCRAFTVYYARAQGTKLRDYSITFTATESKIVRQWVTILNCTINGMRIRLIV